MNTRTLIIAALLCMGLAACTDKSEGQTGSTGQPATADTVEVSLNDTPQGAATRTGLPASDALLDRLENLLRESVDVRVQLQKAPKSKALQDKMDEQAVAWQQLNQEIEAELKKLPPAQSQQFNIAANAIANKYADQIEQLMDAEEAAEKAGAGQPKGPAPAGK